VQVEEDLEEAEFFYEQGMLEEAAEVYRRILDVAPNHPSAMLRMGEIAASLGADPANAAELTADGDSTLPDDETGLDRTVDIADALTADDQAEIDVDLDLDDEASVADAAGASDEPAAERDAGPAASAPPAPVHAHADDSFDLAAELSDVMGEVAAEAPTRARTHHGTEEEAFAHLFETFKRGVNETLAESDYETRYDLAIAYKEMGLLDDAIAAFQACVACPKRGLDSLQLLAHCALEVGRPSDAIDHLKQALSREALADDRRAGLYFDLARAYTDTGDLDRARSTYETVSELSPAFPGLREAVADLLERSGPSLRVDCALDEDEPFESFDDLVAEVTAEAAMFGVRSDEVHPVAEDRTEAIEAWLEESSTSASDAVVEADPRGDTDSSATPSDGAAGGEGRSRPRRKKISFV
jgi:tetratricopeptide (TPR) repeat protein